MIKLYYPFTFLNDYVNIERTNKYAAAKIKRDTTFSLKLMLLGKESIKTPCRLKYTWYIKSKRHDLDNVSFAAKFVNDGLVKAGLIKNDNVNHITEMTHCFEISDKVGVMIEVY